MLFDRLKKLIAHKYYPLNRIEISRKKIINNYQYLCSINKNIKIAPVLKSNAYGHGIVEIAKILDDQNPPFFCVDSIFEAYKLYKIKVKTPILIMGYVNPKNLIIKNLPFSYAVYDLQQLTDVLKYQPNAGIHIFVDTGMHREGIEVHDLEKFIKKIPTNYLNNIEGIMSHFGEAENPKKKETIEQINNFKKAVDILKNNYIFPKWRHIANSSGLLNSKALKLEEISNMARCGFSLYNSALRFITHISQIKELKKGSKIGYSFTYTAKKNMKTAVLPVGYNDGVDRGFSNKGLAIIRGKNCPILGRVSMNITVVDVSEVRDVQVGDEVEIDFKTPLDGKILYEILVHLNSQIKRVVV